PRHKNPFSDLQGGRKWKTALRNILSGDNFFHRVYCYKDYYKFLPCGPPFMFSVLAPVRRWSRRSLGCWKLQLPALFQIIYGSNLPTVRMYGSQFVWILSKPLVRGAIT